MARKVRTVAVWTIIILLPIYFIKFAVIDNIHRKEMCQSLVIALEESGDLAPAWYIEAGKQVRSCVIPASIAAAEYGEYKGCLAMRRDDVSISCDVEEQRFINAKEMYNQ